MRPTVYEDDEMTVERIVVGPLQTNAYIITCRATARAVLVDAGDDADGLIAALGDRELTAILATHGHWDHVEAAAPLAAATRAPFLIHPEDAGLTRITPSSPLGEEAFDFGSVRLSVIHTPGHTPGSVCVVANDAVLTGDTLFPGGPGKTGTEQAFETIIESIRERLFPMSDAMLVLPGHGTETTIGEERPHLGAWVARRW